MPLVGTTIGNFEGLVLNPVFTGLVSSIMPEDLGLKANDFFPRLTFQSNGNGVGFFFRYNMSENFRVLSESDLIRRPSTAAKKINRSRRLETFVVTKRHLDAIVADDAAKLIREQSGGQDDPNVTEVQFARSQMLHQKETRAAALAALAGSVGGSATPATLWDNYGSASSDPIGDLQAAILAVRANSGLEPNTMAIPFEVALKLSYHPKLRPGVQRPYTEGQAMTIDGLTAFLKAYTQFDNIIITKGMKQTTAETRTPSLSLGTVWGKDVYIWYRPPTPSWTALQWGIEVVDTFYYGGTDTAGVFTFYEQDIESTIHRIREDSDFVILNKELAYKLSGVIS